jgi:hypothetical protein
MMEVWSAGSAAIAAITLDGSAASKEALAAALVVVRSWGPEARDTHGSKDWAAVMPAMARETAAMSFILMFEGRLGLEGEDGVYGKLWMGN